MVQSGPDGCPLRHHTACSSPGRRSDCSALIPAPGAPTSVTHSVSGARTPPVWRLLARQCDVGRWGGGSCHASGGTGQDARAVVGGLPVAATGALDLPGARVRGFGAGVGHTGDDQDLGRRAAAAARRLGEGAARGLMVLPAHSSRRRLTPAGSSSRPRRPFCSRITRWRTAVTMSLAGLDQAEGVHAGHGGRQLLAQRLPEGSRRAGRHHLDRIPPCLGAGGHPGADVGGAAAADHAQHPVSMSTRAGSQGS